MANLLARIILRKFLQIIIFICAFVIGAFIAFIYKLHEDSSIHPHHFAHLWTHGSNSVDSLSIGPGNYSIWLASKNLTTKSIPEEVISFDLNSQNSKGQSIKLESEYLKNEIPILCLIWSKNKNLAKSVQLTWGKNCNKFYFVSTYSDKNLPILPYSSLEPSHMSFCKILIKLKSTISKIKETFKWILLAQDSSFVILENARHFVAPLNYSRPFYLGRPVKTAFDSPIHNKLDSSILLSIGALNYIYDKFFLNYASCNVKSFHLTGENNVSHVLNVSRQMEWSLAQMLAVDSVALPLDTSDVSGSKFLPMSLVKHLIEGNISPYNPIWRQDVTRTPSGPSCCSNELISFNDLTPTKMYLTNYFLYHLSVFKDSPCGLGNKRPRLYSANSLFKGKDSLDSVKNNLEIGSGSSYYLTTGQMANGESNLKYTSTCLTLVMALLLPLNNCC